MRAWLVPAILATGFLPSSEARACDFGTFWTGGCNKEIEKVLTPPPLSSWVPPPPAKTACGARGQRPCTVVERIPSCGEGLTESIGQGKCVTTPAGQLPFLATVSELGGLAVAAGKQAQAACLKDGNAAAAAAPGGLFSDPAFNTIDAQRLRYVGVGFGCAAPRILDTLDSLQSVDPRLWRNVELAFNQAFRTRPCAEMMLPSHRAACAASMVVLGDSVKEVQCLVKAAQALPAPTATADSVAAYNAMGEAVFVLLQWALEQYIQRVLGGALAEAFKKKVIGKTIASDLQQGRHGADLQRDYAATARRIDRVYQIMEKIMLVKDLNDLRTKLQKIPECGGAVSEPTSVGAKVAGAVGTIAQGTAAAVGPRNLYIVNAAGDLLYFRHDAHGRFTTSGKVIGNGWNEAKFVGVAQAGSGAAVYAVFPNGDLYLYEHDEAGRFAARVKIGTGWAGFEHVLVARKGVLYVVDQAGALVVYKHHPDGTFYETKRIGTGWGGFTRIVSGGANAFYVQTTDGNLRYYYHDDNYRWVHANKVIGNGWSFPFLTSAGNGELYGVDSWGDLLYYRHDSAHRWVAESGKPIGIGFGQPGKFGLLAAAN